MTPSIREVYGQTLAEIGAENDRIVVLDADVSASTRSIVFAEKFPHRFFNCGIAEANMAAMAAGLAHGGMTVFANTFAAFITTNSLLSVRSLIAYSHANVKLMGAYAGLSDAYDGYTHHSIDDLAIMRAIPDMRVMVASDAEQTRFLLRYAAETDGPMYIRLSRDAMNDLNRYGRLTFGKGSVLREGTDATILAWRALRHRVPSRSGACQAEYPCARGGHVHHQTAGQGTCYPQRPGNGCVGDGGGALRNRRPWRRGGGNADGSRSMRAGDPGRRFGYGYGERTVRSTAGALRTGCNGCR